MADYEDENEVLIEIEPEDSDFVEEEEKQPPVWSSGCYATKRAPTPCKDISFSTQGVFGKEQGVQLIIDNDSCKNIVFTALVDYK